MQVTEIFRKLPKTNCRECGEATCIAFALKCQTGQRLISECPYAEAVEAEGALSGTVQDSYEEAGNRMEARLGDLDFKSAAAAAGASYNAERDLMEIVMLGRKYEVRRSGLFLDGVHSRNSWDRLIIYDFILRRSGMGLSGERVPLQHFPKTPSHVKSFQGRAEAELGKVFGLDPLGIRSRLDELGAEYVSSEAGAELACRLELLPGFPLYLEFWSADDEFPASCKFFVDSSAVNKLDIEYIARVTGKAVNHLAGYAVQAV